MPVTRQKQDKTEKQDKRKDPPAPRQQQGEGESKADIFDQTKPQGVIDGGKYVALIAELVLQDADEKGQSVRINYEIASEGEFRGQKVAQFYKCFEADGSAGKGLAFLKRDMAILGYPDCKFGELKDVFEEIVEKEMGANVTVKQNGQFTNVYLDGLCEDSTVLEEYLENRVF